MTARATYLPVAAYFHLNNACYLVSEALGDFGCYLVGSAVKSADYRDVDIRFIMPDEAYDRLFTTGGTAPDAKHPCNPFWALICTLISDHLSKASGLPVDFQIQRMSRANALYSAKEGHTRHAIGISFGHRVPDDVRPR